jgi:hypothetical protein
MGSKCKRGSRIEIAGLAFTGYKKFLRQAADEYFMLTCKHNRVPRHPFSDALTCCNISALILERAFLSCLADLTGSFSRI